MQAPSKALIPEEIAENDAVTGEGSSDAYEMWIDASEDCTRSNRTARKPADPAFRFDLDEYFFVAS